MKRVKVSVTYQVFIEINEENSLVQEYDNHIELIRECTKHMFSESESVIHSKGVRVINVTPISMSTDLPLPKGYCPVCMKSPCERAGMGSYVGPDEEDM